MNELMSACAFSGSRVKWIWILVLPLFGFVPGSSYLISSCCFLSQLQRMMYLYPLQLREPGPQPSRVAGSWSWGLGTWVGHGHRAPKTGISALVAKTPRELLCSFSMWGWSWEVGALTGTFLHLHRRTSSLYKCEKEIPVVCKLSYLVCGIFF